MNLLLATTNKDKLREYRELFAGHKITLKHLSKDFSVEETGKTFAENAVIKARAYGEKFQVATVADDTGLEIKALNNEPGIYSNRFANGNFVKARAKILEKLNNITDRRARFVCVLAMWLPNGKIKTFTGSVTGKIARKEKSGFGFGYDPIFLYPGDKMQIGHRARAVKKFLVYNKAYGQKNRR